MDVNNQSSQNPSYRPSHVSWTPSSIILASLPLHLILVLVLRALYNVYLHPLSAFKGPWYLAVSEIPLAYLQLKGISHHVLAKAHQKYGSVVRIAPSTLSFIDSEAWNDIYGDRKGRAALPKDPLFYNEMLLDKRTLTISSGSDAIPIRRAMNPAFSPKALTELEPMFQGHANLLMAQLAKASLTQSSVDIRMWLTCSLFDVTSDFAFGEDLGCVKNGKYHEWAQFVVSFFYAATFLHQCHKFWPLSRILAVLMPPSVKDKKKRHEQAALLRVRRRLNTPTERHDLMSHFLQNAEKEGIERSVIEAQATVVILAGSKTTATLLIAAVYYILANKDICNKLCDEIRSAFANPSKITLRGATTRLPYLSAVIKETLRIHTPLANGVTRVVPNGTMINGFWVPKSAVVIINCYCANRSPQNFRDPHTFVPERWLGDPIYDSDKRDVVQPFSVGPRDCIGKRFALNNVYLTLTHLIWNFDMQLSDASRDWAVGQKIYNDWQVPELFVALKKRI